MHGADVAGELKVSCLTVSAALKALVKKGKGNKKMAHQGALTVIGNIWNIGGLGHPFCQAQEWVCSD